jgi:tetratricopeptide (TPR) repeat protein
VRREAARALGQIGDERAVEPLVQALGEDEETNVRRAAAEALGQIGDERAVEPLMWALSEGLEEVRQSAAFALAEMASDRTLDAIDQAIARNDDQSWPYCAKGRALRNMKRYNEAVEAFSEAIKLDETDCLGRGITSYMWGRMEQAEADYRRFIGLRPSRSVGHNNLAYLLYDLGRVEEAMEEWKQAVKLAPGGADELAGLALGLFAQGKRQKALRLYCRTLRLERRYTDWDWLRKEHFWSEKAIETGKAILELIEKSG